MGDCISLEWAKQTGGSLTSKQKRMFRGAVLRGFRDFARGMLTAPLHRSSREVTVPTPPDSKLAAAAEEAGQDQPISFMNHGYRTWIFGSILAQIDGAVLDDEYFYVGALLHDTGLATQVVGEDFTIRSAETALAVCAKVGITGSDAAALADGIVAHFTPGLEAADSVLGFYVQAGALADLLGSRSWEIANDIRKAAYLDHPSHGAHSEIPSAVMEESKAVPDGRPALVHKCGFGLAIRMSPMRRFG
jgi:hypothetical protein